MNTKQKFLVVSAGLAMMIATGSAFAGNGAAGANAASPARPDASAGASVVGKVKFTGTLPQPAKVSMNSDPSCAKLHSGPAVSQDYVTGSDNSLSNVIVFNSEGLGNRTFDSRTQEVTFEQKGCMYEPHVVAMRTNQKLKMVNSDNTTHNIHPLPSNNREWNKAEPAGSTMEESFPREEVAIPVKCNVHPWMKSYIDVFKHPYFAVSGKNGAFEIKNVPPGTYTVQAWHEKLGTKTQQVTIGSNESKTLEFDFK